MLVAAQLESIESIEAELEGQSDQRATELRARLTAARAFYTELKMRAKLDASAAR